MYLGGHLRRPRRLLRLLPPLRRRLLLLLLLLLLPVLGRWRPPTEAGRRHALLLLLHTCRYAAAMVRDET